MRDFSKPALPAFVNNEYQHSCSNLRREFRTLFYLLSILRKRKTRTTAKLQNYPPQNSLKLPLPIVKNCHNLEIVLTYCVLLKHCQYFQIENYIYEIGKSAICWLGSVMNHATRNQKQRKIFVISGKNLSINKR